MITVFLKAILLLFLSAIYLPSFLIVTLLGGTWRGLLEELGL